MAEKKDQERLSWGERFVAEADVEVQPYDTIIAIARRHYGRSGRSPVARPDMPIGEAGIGSEGGGLGEAARLPEDDAMDFLVYLRMTPALAKSIKSHRDLERSYRKWVTERGAPAEKEIWSILSRALLQLEQEGKVQRGLQYRGHNNANAVRWYMKGCEGRSGRHLSPSEAASVIPPLSARSEKKRLLSPAEARTIVESLLTLAHGEVAMEEIFELVRPHLLLFKVEPAQSPHGDENEGNDANAIEDLAVDVVAPYKRQIVNEEIESRSRCLWEKVGKLRRGTKTVVEGLRVLCCYYMPAIVFKKKVNMEAFGPTSTVQDVVNDIKQVMAACLDGLVQSEKYADKLQLPAKEVVHGILKKIQRECSEKHPCTAFIIQ